MALKTKVIDWLSGMATGTADPYWLTLAGRSGCGKTFLAKKADHVFDRLCSYVSGGFQVGDMVRFSRPGAWIDCAELSTKTFAEQREAIIKAQGAWFCVIDDLGAENHQNNFTVSQMLALMNRRLGKWTFITSNLSIDKLGAIDERIASRLERDGNQFIEIKSLGDWAHRDRQGRQA